MAIGAENTSAEQPVNINFSSFAFSNLFNSCLTDRNINYNGGGSLVAKLSAVDCAISTLSRTRASRVRFPVTACQDRLIDRSRFNVPKTLEKINSKKEAK